jgi:hypothetical protein
MTGLSDNRTLGNFLKMMSLSELNHFIENLEKDKRQVISI